MNADAILSYAAKSKDSANSLSLFANTIEDDVAENRLSKNLPKTTPWTFGERLSNELVALGFYISAHPLDQYKHLIARARLATSATLESKPDRAQVMIAVNVNSFSRRRTKNGKDMISINASDSIGNVDAVAFGENAAEFAQMLSSESVVLLAGKVSNRDDRVSVFVDSIIPLADWVAKTARKMTLDVRDQSVLPDVKKILDSLPNGNTRVVLNLHNGKVVTLSLPKTIELMPTTAQDLSGFGVRVDID
jgi:DNA polymerase-3 subunit alpha